MQRAKPWKLYKSKMSEIPADRERVIDLQGGSDRGNDLTEGVVDVTIRGPRRKGEQAT